MKRIGSQTSSSSVVIVGASHSASQLCVALRQNGWRGSITVIGEEETLPYHRPPLSKDLLSGKKTLDQLLLRPEATYQDADIQMRLGDRVEAIHRSSKTIVMRAGDDIVYNKLILCTGARPRKLLIPGAERPGVYYLRSAADAEAIKTNIKPGRRAVIIGGGYIGLEVAASLRQQGLTVVVLEAMARILQRVTAPEVSAFFGRIHAEEGVTIEEGLSAYEIVADAGELSVRTQGDKAFAADMVIVGIGVLPNQELAEDAGLSVGDGIIVDEFCRTSDPDIYAAGDVSWHYCPQYDRRVRLESVPNAHEQAKTVALHLTGREKPYDQVPWFWSDQFDLKLQIAGLSDGYDELIVRGDIASSRSFAAFYFCRGALIAVDAVNAPREYMFARQVLTKRLDLRAEQLADTAVSLKETIIS